MISIRGPLFLGLLLSAVLVAMVLNLAPARATPGDGISLMQTISEWKYPGSTMLGGASMSDGGNPEMADLKCQAVLTTPDSVEAVARFYNDKTQEGHAQAVSTQDDAKGRPVDVRVISVHQADISTTLVISRGEGEKETHIAWSQYRRLSK